MAEDIKAANFKICGVCGDKAMGYNFNAITCESCKAFFRRNALKTKDFKCPFNNDCKVDVITRRFCQRCRLNKCLEIGMKKEWILTDEEKQLKNAKIKENRQKRYVPYQCHKKKCVESTIKRIHSYSPVEVRNITDFCKHRARFIKIKKRRKTLFTPEPSCPASLLFGDSVEKQADSCSDSNEMMSLTSEHGSGVFSDSELNQNSIPVTLVSDESGIIFNSDKEKQTKHSLGSDLSPSLVKTNSKKQSTLSALINSNPPSSVPKLPTSLLENGVDESHVSSSTVHTDIQSSRASRLNGSFDPFIPDSLDYYKISSDLNPSHFSNQSKKDDSIIPRSVIDLAVKVEFDDIPLQSQDYCEEKLTEAEKAKLTELIIANEVLKMPLSYGNPDPSLLDVINMTDHAIRRLIKMSKRIYSFKTLCQEDQISLLKGGCTELMLLRSVMTYDPEKDCWQGPQTVSIKVDILKEARGNIYEEHKRFINSFDPLWRSNENIMLILSAITLFTPERPNIVHKNVIRFEQESYYYLLQRYLHTIYSEWEARSSYLMLISKLEELHLLNENHVRIFLDVNPKDVEPLLIEIFDLKH
ncbi:nuclear hormone receptor HR96-like [Limulus polyphemus]|uniref:Nuclear hormone receptor HR96-like n=1 Tax=Limulus polyphemus TaxID=6850 RepID=A0ABM1TQR7_LIMPO|nr:nuclear hormone receptor HR96-like [Limulus polyphemus]XP_022258223.1 nuclear hormone receptor HR96-like [Limulus polyphemus]